MFLVTAGVCLVILKGSVLKRFSVILPPKTVHDTSVVFVHWVQTNMTNKVRMFVTVLCALFNIRRKLVDRSLMCPLDSRSGLYIFTRLPLGYSKTGL